jgi:hypothetical protein
MPDDEAGRRLAEAAREVALLIPELSKHLRAAVDRSSLDSMASVSPASLAALPCGAAIFLVLDETRRAVAGRIAK